MNSLVKILLAVVATLGLHSVAQAQIDLFIKRGAGDSVTVAFDKNMNLYTDSVYAFMIQTNLSPEDSVFENLTGELVEDGKIVQTVFRQDEFIFSVYRLNADRQPVAFRNQLLLIKGTRFLVTVDGHPVRRHLPSPVTPSSVIQIRLVSERLTPEELTVKDPVIFSWHRGQDWQQTEQLNGQSLSLPVSRLQGLVAPDSSSRAVVPVLIVLPQVFDKNQSPLLPENAQERLLTLSFKE